jgi:hypothetical protein
MSENEDFTDRIDDVEPVAAAPEAPVPTEVVPQLTLNDFCARKSETMARPELLGAFAHVERAAGRGRDSVAAFERRFADFINQPA